MNPSDATTLANTATALRSSGGALDITFGDVPALPTQSATDGVLFDFNDGLRVKIPADGNPCRVRFSDLDTFTTVFDVIAPPGCQVVSNNKYFIRFRLELLDPVSGEVRFCHDFNAAGKLVAVRFPVHTLGDSIGWFSYLERFQRKHGCRLICVTEPWFAAIVRKQYPEIRFLTREEAAVCPTYANYNIGLWEIGNTTCQPVDHRYVGLHRLAAHILGVDEADEPPRFDLSAPRRIAEPYVCIGVQSTCLAKFWNHPDGWEQVTAFLKAQGYRVLCIDKERIGGKGGTFVRMPSSAEDFTGDLPLQERIDLLKDAACFVGLSSGLSWLAWGCGVPAVVISGFSDPRNEFANPFRVINRNVCNSCWNDFKAFDLEDFWHCPRLGTTERRFECTAMISPEYVISMIERALHPSGAAEPKFQSNSR